MKNPWRAFGILALLEIGVFLLLGTAIWAIFSHDLASLESSFMNRNDSLMHRGFSVGDILAICAAALTIVNLGVGYLAWRNGRPVPALAFLGLSVGLFVLLLNPKLYVVGGFAVSVGGIIAFLILRALWRIVSWPFRKLFGKKRDPEEAVPSRAPKAKIQSKA